MSFFSKFKTNLVSGLLALTPLAAVIWILVWMWRKIYSLKGLVPESLDPHYFLDLNDFSTPLNLALHYFISACTTLLLLTLIILFVAAVGYISRHILGQRILQALERFMKRIPVLSTVYSTLDQLLETFGGAGSSRNFRRVVIIEYPRAGIYALALVTGERMGLPLSNDPVPSSPSKERFLNVFVPTTPNPTSGFFLSIPEKDVQEVDLSVEEALKQIISMGMIH